ncbi:MAG TPA: DUF885 domain-containing protein [Steroidobacter sp.]
MTRRVFLPAICASILCLTIGVAQAQRRAPDLKPILDDVWEWRLDRSPSLRLQYGLPVEHIAPNTLARAERDAEFARSILSRLDALPAGKLTPEQSLNVRILRYEMSELIEAPRYFWLGFEVTPYQSGFFTNNVWPVFSQFTFAGPEDARRYLRLVNDYAVCVEEMLSRLKEQERRSIRIPAPALPGVIKLFSDYSTGVPRALHVSDERLAALSSAEREQFQAALGETVAKRLVPALRSIAEYLSGPYSKKAPATVGMSQYVDGKDYYRRMLRVSTTLDLTPEEVRDLGLKRMAELKRRMAEVRRQLGFEGDQAAFHAFLKTDRRFIAASPGDLEAVYKRCLERIEPALPKLFHSLPRAPYGVKRVRPEAEAGMTFGYYGRPQTPGGPGYYFYNGSGLESKPTFTACAMIYHELVPGHHFHVARQQENERLHPVQRTNYAFFAYNEGWAEYAASLGIEAGAYADPYSLYGRYLMQSHVYARLVLDTGLNYFGWTLQQAHEYLREATLLSDQEIRSDLLRYSTDLPGQALSYGIGFETIWKLRRRAEQALGENFDVRDFHEVVLGSGGMPLSILEQKVDAYIRRRSAAEARAAVASVLPSHRLCQNGAPRCRPRT